ncbi:elongation factor P [Candidatus Gottesmanbacteria bacterium]|nr:elongation factor P [Candidatus Gottesmanbacteria bacterium]
MIEVTQLRAGTVFEENNQPWMVLKYEHVKMGRGTATIKLKVKSLKSKVTTERTFISGARVQEVNLEKKKGQFLYKTGENLVFMDPVSYEQFVIAENIIGDQAKFLKEEAEVDLKLYEGQTLSVVLPLKMKFKITDTEPGFKGNSVTNIYKDAVLETGAHIKIPLFVENNEFIIVNTETGEYVERAK